MRVKFTNNVSLEDSLVFEQDYPKNLKFDLEDKQWLKDKGAEFIYMLDADTNELIGETYYIPLDYMKDWEADEHQMEDGLEPFYGQNAVYCYSNTILPKYQKQGLGRIIKSYFLGYIKAKGFSLSVAHARNNGSIQLNKSFGAEVIGEFANWFQTGETVYLYKQQL